MLLAETHLTDRNCFKIRGYSFYDNKRPDGTARGGSGVLVKTRIKHHAMQGTSEDDIQATSVCIQDGYDRFIASAIYCRPGASITSQRFQSLLDTFGQRFIAMGDFNAKHTHWGSRLCTTRGKQLYDVIFNDRAMDILSSGSPTHWPTDQNKRPDLLDFGIIKNMNKRHFKVENIPELSSDHSPQLVTYAQAPVLEDPPIRLTNKHTKWNSFRRHISAHLNTSMQLRNEDDVETALSEFNSSIKAAAEAATPTAQQPTQHDDVSASIRDLLTAKRNARRRWQAVRSPTSKAELNRATRELTTALRAENNAKFQAYVERLTPRKETDYDLWKAAKFAKRPTIKKSPLKRSDGTWANSDEEKANTFADHLAEVFKPQPAQTPARFPAWFSQPVEVSRPWTCSTTLTRDVVKSLNPKKAPGHDLITARMVKQLPECAIDAFTKIVNAILKLGYFPATWKHSEIAMIPKPGKDLRKPGSYRPISLLPTLSKVFEKIILAKLQPHLEDNRIIPDFQFGFRQQHGTVDQAHRVVSDIREAYEKFEYCSALFLDVAQAFDKVWHEGLFFKIRRHLPRQSHKILQSYLESRNFKVKCGNEKSTLKSISAGVPQGSVLGQIGRAHV